jgi:hypothetical protein
MTTATTTEVRSECGVSQTDGREPVGSVAEEAAKLFGVLSGWARDHGEGVASYAEGFHERAATGTAECTWCPLCRTVAVIRHTTPEARAHLAQAGSSLMLAVAGMMAPPRPTDDGRVERIGLDSEWPEDE